MQSNSEATDNSQNTGSGNLTASLNAPSISLPKGGGAIKGIGEKFASNPVTGTVSLSIPIATSPGRSGFDPELSLSYDSSAGNGVFGFGWSLSLPAITRKTDKGLPTYQDNDESDVFQISGAEDLVPVLIENSNKRYEDSTSVPDYTIHHYRPRIEGLFARIERWTNNETGRIHWRTISKDNITTFYGKSDNSCIADPADPECRIFSWLISTTYDDKGNAIVYEYVEENDHNIDINKANERNRQHTANRYIKRILYGNKTPNRNQNTWEAKDPHELPREDWLFEVVFDYNEGHCHDTKPALIGQHHIAFASNTEQSLWTLRPDPFSSYRSGFEIRTNRRCQRVLMFHHFSELGNEPCLIRSTDFDYTDIDYSKTTTAEKELAHKGSTRFASFILSATQSAYKNNNDTDIPERYGYISYRKKIMPPLEFAYSKATIQDDICKIDINKLENLPIGLDDSIYKWIDLDGEGISGILTEQADAWYYKRNLSPLHQDQKCHKDGKTKQKIEFSALECIATKPNINLANTNSQFMDLAGDGQLDVVDYSDSIPGFYERTHDGNWKTFQPFSKQLNIPWDEPNLRFVDLNGDGHADVLITEQNIFTWYASDAEKGFSAAKHVSQPHDEERGPRLVFADGTQSIFLADMSGDGLSDLLRIRNGEICYWPNLGYARFGAKVSMDNSPWFDYQEQFDYQRLRLADIDGSGTNDIIYLGRGKVSVYFNQSGNQWTEARVLEQFPHIDNLTTVTTTDLLGNGTACLVWSSPLPDDARQPMRYIDLMGGQKPHLLTRSINNLGAETHIYYAPSTKFYLQDEQNGTPWITKIPFPVHVVERVETIDKISKNRFTSRYAYHHGYFDGVEREFRGFGMVEQWDTEEFAVIKGNDDFLKNNYIADEKDKPSNVNPASHIPPIHTKTWFHTGAHGSGNKFSTQYLHEYFAAPIPKDNKYETSLLSFEKTLLPDTILPNSLTVEEEREACRILKGAMLRQEVYADDDSNKADIPYTITEQNFTVECLQHKGKSNKHAVFLSHEREAISYHYERNTNDPRITHAMTLDVDEYGNVRKTASLAYGRQKKSTDKELTIEDHQQQRLIHITSTETSYTNPVNTLNTYRTPLPAEISTYEVRKPKQQNSEEFKGRYYFAQMINLLEQAADGQHDIDYDDLEFKKAIAKAKLNPMEKDNYSRRLVEQARICYRSDALEKKPLPFGKIESLALPFESYQLAFTKELLQSDKIYKRTRNVQANIEPLLSDDALKDAGYIDLDKDGNWWIPSGQVFFHSKDNTSAEDELKEAQKNFFLPSRFQDPFGNNAWVDYDKYKLFAIKTEDAVNNEIRAKYNYRVLQPSLMKDPNDNHTKVAFDIMGMVVGTAIMGKVSKNLGKIVKTEADSLDGFQPDINQQQIKDLLADPKGNIAHILLGNATSRIIYDVNRYQKKNEPSFAITLARETHVSDLKIDPNTGSTEITKIQVSLSYFDGFGREIQKKVQAEQGLLPQRDNAGNLVLDGCYPRMEDGKGKLRWVGSGWTIFNNKGKPVCQYEPFFTDRSTFEFEVCIGVSPVLFYDPLGRVVSTLHPNHSYDKVVFDPWKQTTWDVNDTVLLDPKKDLDISFTTKNYFSEKNNWQSWYEQRKNGASGKKEKEAAIKAAAHANTPSTAHFDTLGRPLLTLSHNGFEYGDKTKPILYATRIELDIEGNERVVIDARNNTVMQYAYNMAGSEEDEDEEGTATNLIYQDSMDAGERWALNDIAGNPIHNWDSRGHHFWTEYDELRRPVKQFIRGEYKKENQADGHESDPASVKDKDILFEQVVYGEDKGQDNGKKANLRGQPYQIYDSSACTTNISFDFKGNVLKEQKQHVNDPIASLTDWSDANLQTALHAETFARYSEYDAPGRITQQYNWHIDPNRIAVYQSQYNERGLLIEESFTIQAQKTNNDFSGGKTSKPVSAITYDAKGQRQSVRNGNDTITRYKYDPLTFRLEQLRTTRSGFDTDFPNFHSDLQSKKVVQQLFYTYDPVGNITEIVDEAYEPVFFNNQQVKPQSHYSYDPLYRLIKAEGRESASAKAPNQFEGKTIRATFPVTDQALRNFIQHYIYDSVGNILEMKHVATNGNWTRHYKYDNKSNRLLSSLVGNDNTKIITYRYDTHGNMLNFANVNESINWDYRDMIHSCNLKGGGTVYYSYDTEKQRSRKYIERKGSIIEERFYLDGIERYRRWKKIQNNSELLEEIETHHLFVDEQRVLLVEDIIKTDSNNLDIGVLYRYQYSNHLGSVALEMDEKAKIISYEEYHPYGTSAYQIKNKNIKASYKRYRYTGMERDEETGLNSHGARYYATWLGRWASADPNGLIDGLNVFTYTRNSPITYLDASGTQRRWVHEAKVRVHQAIQHTINEYKKLARNPSGRQADRASLAALNTTAVVVGTIFNTGIRKILQPVEDLVVPVLASIPKEVDELSLSMAWCPPGAMSLKGLGILGSSARILRRGAQVLKHAKRVQIRHRLGSGLGGLSVKIRGAETLKEVGGATRPVKEMIKSARTKGVKQAKLGLWERYNTSSLTSSDIETLKRLEDLKGRGAVERFQRTGKLPPDFEGGHMLSASANPEVAHNPDLIRITDRLDHYLGQHGGDWGADPNLAYRNPDWEKTWGFYVTDKP